LSRTVDDRTARLGLDHEKLTGRASGRNVRLTDVYGKVVHEAIA
jgi:hypothetical protein